MSRFDNFTDKISYIDFHESSDEIRTIESLRNLLTVEYNNYIETLDIVPLPIRKQLSTKYYTRKHFIEKLINLIETLSIIDYLEEHIEDITVTPRSRGSADYPSTRGIQVARRHFRKSGRVSFVRVALPK